MRAPADPAAAAGQQVAEGPNPAPDPDATPDSDSDSDSDSRAHAGKDAETDADCDCDCDCDVDEDEDEDEDVDVDAEPDADADADADGDADTYASEVAHAADADADGDDTGACDDTGGDAGVRPTRPELLGQAFCALLERFPNQRLPKAGGVSASVVVLLDYENLLTGLGTAKLDTGEHISAALARRLACDAGIIPAVYQKVLGGRPVVLDLGRTRRFHTPHQRIALGIEQGGCTAETCDRPPGWCEAHHDQTSWAQGGGTSVKHGRLLCAYHHHIAHNPRYHTERLTNGTLRFHRTT